MGEPDPDFKAFGGGSESQPSHRRCSSAAESGFTKKQVKELEEYTTQMFEDGRSESSERDIDVVSDDEESEGEEVEEVEVAAASGAYNLISARTKSRSSPRKFKPP